MVCSQHFAALLMIIYTVSSSNSGVYFKHAPYVFAWGHVFSLNIISQPTSGRLGYKSYKTYKMHLDYHLFALPKHTLDCANATGKIQVGLMKGGISLRPRKSDMSDGLLLTMRFY